MRDMRGMNSVTAGRRSRPGLLARGAYVTLVALVAGCAGDSARPVRLGICAWPGYEFLYLAQEKGLFGQEGVAVKIVELSSLGDVRRAFERGQVDGMVGTLVEFLQARGNPDRSPQVILVLDYSQGADVILARSPIEDPAGLRGRRVAVEMGSLNVFVLARALERVALDLDDIIMISMDQPRMEEMFARGRVDAVVSYPPYSGRMMEKEGVRRIFSTADIPGEVVDIVALEASLIARRPETAARIARGFDRALAYAADHPGESYHIMAAREGISPEELRRALEEGIRLVPLAEQARFLAPGGTLEETIKATDQVLRRTGQIAGPDRTGECIVWMPTLVASSK